MLDLVDATGCRSNTAYAQLMLEVGPENVVDLAERPRASPPSSPAVPSLVLGTGDVSLLDMAVGYSHLRQPGRAQRPRHDHPDRAVPTATVVRRRSPPDRDAGARPPTRPTTVNYCLERGRRGRHRRRRPTSASPAAGKTGTTQNNTRRLVRRLHAASSPPRCGWATTRRQPSTMDASVHGIEAVTGGTLPARDLAEVHASRRDRGRRPARSRAGHRRRVPGHGPQPRSCADHADHAADVAEHDRARPSTTTSTDDPTTDRPPRHDEPTDHDDRRRPDDGPDAGSRRGVDGLVRVVGAAGEAPALDLVDAPRPAPACPTPRA